MSTGIDVSADAVVANLSEMVDRGAALLATGSRLAGPAGPQDMASELLPSAPGDCVGVGLLFDDGSVASVVLTRGFATELCGGATSGEVVPGLQTVIDQLAGGPVANLLESMFLADGAAIEGFLDARPHLLGAGVFDGDAVVATVGAAGASAPAPSPAAAPAAASTPDPAPAPAAAPAAPAASAPAAAPIPTNATPSVVNASPAAAPFVAPSVSDAVLARGLALLADVSLELTVELGRAHVRVSELLTLEPGSIIDLDREAGSPVDLLVNGTLFARAEVIVVENNYAVRITELVSADNAT